MCRYTSNGCYVIAGMINRHSYEKTANPPHTFCCRCDQAAVSARALVNEWLSISTNGTVMRDLCLGITSAMSSLESTGQFARPVAY